MVTPDSSGGRAGAAFRLFDTVVSGLLVVTKFLARSTVLLVDGADDRLTAGFAAGLVGAGLAADLVDFAGAEVFPLLTGTFFNGAFFAGAAFFGTGFDAGLGAGFFAETGLACFFTDLATVFALATGLRAGALAAALEVAVLDTVFARADTFALLALAAAFGLLLAIPKPIL